MENKCVAVFIDAENINAKYAESIFNIASSYGEIVVKRIYADWTSEQVKDWQEQIKQHSITAIQNFKFVAKKNSSDIYLVIETMNMLYNNDIDIFVIVSSDSDYTLLVRQLREKNKKAIGIGLNQSIEVYVNAFNVFHYLNQTNEHAKDKQEIAEEKELFNIIEQLIKENGRAEYGQIGQMIRKKFSNFNPKNHGCSSFKQLMNKFAKDKYQEKRLQDNCTFYLAKQ